MDLLKELSMLTGRVITIFPLVLFLALLMGRRSINQLTVFDFLIFISIGSVVGADIADPEVQHIHTAYVLLLVTLLQRLFAYWHVKSKWFGKKISFEPLIVIKDGFFVIEQMEKSKYTVDMVLQMLRQQQIFDISTVAVGVLEANGNISIHLNNQNAQVTLKDLGLIRGNNGLSYTIIRDGKILKDVTKALNLKESHIYEQLASQQVELADVFYGAINDRHELTLTTASTKLILPPIYH